MCLKESSATKRMWLDREFTDLGAGVSYLGVFMCGLICCRLSVYREGDSRHLVKNF